MIERVVFPCRSKWRNPPEAAAEIYFCSYGYVLWCFYLQTWQVRFKCDGRTSSKGTFVQQPIKLIIHLRSALSLLWWPAYKPSRLKNPQHANVALRGDTTWFKQILFECCPTKVRFFLSLSPIMRSHREKELQFHLFNDRKALFLA